VPVPEDPDRLRSVVEDDVRAVLEGPFPGELTIPEPFADALPIGGGDVTAVPWRWTGVHEGEFLGLRRTGRPVDVTGVTLLRAEGDALVFHRIVDWADLYAQIGDAVGGRRHHDGTASTR
jgi:hypothetical protein